MTARELIRTIDPECMISIYEGVVSDYPYIYNGSPKSAPSWLLDYSVVRVEVVKDTIIISLRFDSKDGARRARVTTMVIMAVMFIILELAASDMALNMSWQLHAAVALGILTSFFILWV